MTREEAIKVLKRMKYPYNCNAQKLIISNVDRDNEAFEMAIQALSQEPTVTSTDEPMTIIYPTIVCDDAISREAVLDTTICEGISCNECSFNEIDGESGCLLHARIDELPSVTQKSGKWDRSCTCSVCGKWRILESEKNDGKYKYCPNCGAKMESEEKE